MRLLVDLQACQGPSGERGIGYYAVALTRALAEQRGDHEVLVLLDGAADPQATLAVRERLRPALGRDDVVLVPPGPPGLGREAVREAALAASGCDAVLVTSVFELPDAAAMSMHEWCADLPVAALLYDLIPLDDLDTWKPGREQRREYLEDVDRLAHADLLLTISDYTAREARRLLPSCPLTVTVHGAAAQAAAPRAPLSPPAAGYALAVGRDERRKDLRTAVLAWAAVDPRVRGQRAFVVVGPWPSENRAQLRAQAGLAEHELVFLDSVRDDELTWLYAHAGLFVFPSLQEGLGLPPLEAMALGTPTLLARSSSLVELVDGDAPYFAPGDVAGLTALMTRVLTDDAFADTLRALGAASAGRFTWASTAERAWRALEALPPRAPAGPHEEPVVHRLDDAGAWASADLHERPGVGVVTSSPPEGVDAGLALAACPAVLVPDATLGTALLRAGVTHAPVQVVADVSPRGNGVGEAVAQAYATDLPGHWARAAARHGLELPPGTAVTRRPRWSNRARGPLLATDVSNYRSTAFLSGIQRATRRLHDVVADLLAPEGGALVPVHLGARTPPATPHPTIAADPVLAAAEVRLDEPDWLLCLDLDDRLATARDEVQRARAAGVGVATNVFDVLPWAHPEWWPKGAAAASFVPWLEAALHVSDVVLVNSMATAVEVERFVAAHRPQRPDGFEVQLLRLGADLEHTGGPGGAREPDHFLMVGTVEPRKGHREALDAFEQLWRSGSTARLTVLGRAGWMVEDVVDRMDALAQSQPLFRWLKNAPDSELDRLYGTCTAVVLASHGEGFGLPVVEAAVRGCPVVVRDIPVLRELAGDDATYFTDDLPAVLQRVLREGAAVPSSKRVHTWQQVGQRLLHVLGGQVEPRARWSPAGGWSWT